MLLRNRSRNRRFAQENPGFPTPPVTLAYDAYGTVDWHHYRDAGSKIAEKLAARINEHGGGSSLKTLEWGCGPGCVIRQLRALLPDSVEMFGTDYNEQTIEWCRKSLPGITFATNDLEPPLKFPDDTFDVVCGLSVLTHLSADNCAKWLAELARVAKPGGLIMVTTKGEAQQARMLPEEIEAIAQGQPIIRGKIVEGKRMYDTFLPVSFMKAIIPPEVDLVSGEPGSLAEYENQDFWLMKKKTRA